MNLFDNKNTEHSGHEKKCACGKNGVCLNKNQTSRIVALLLIIACFIFITGYFWGQRTAINQLLNSVERDSFADQIHYSMCAMYDQKDDENNESDASTNDEENDQSEQHDDNESVAESTPIASVATSQAISKTGTHKKYVAQLAGFGTEKHAKQLMQRLDRKGIKVELRKRNSRTARGKNMPWYQVVTPQYADRSELNKVVGSIKRLERLHDIQVVETV